MAIIGEAEPMELRWESSSELRRRTRRMIRKARTQLATMARNPRTTITAIAQWGKSLLVAPCCTAAVDVGLDVGMVVNRKEVSEAATEEEDAAAADDKDAIDAATESAKVVWTAVKVACAI